MRESDNFNTDNEINIDNEINTDNNINIDNEIRNESEKRILLSDDLKDGKGIYSDDELTPDKLPGLMQMRFPRFGMTTMAWENMTDERRNLRKETYLEKQTAIAFDFYKYVNPKGSWKKLSTDEKFAFFIKYEEKINFFNKVGQMYEMINDIGDWKKLSSAEKEEFINNLGDKSISVYDNLHHKGSYLELSYADKTEMLAENPKYLNEELEKFFNNYGLDEKSVYKDSEADLRKMGFDPDVFEFSVMGKEESVSDQYVQDPKIMEAEAAKYGINSVDALSLKRNVNIIDSMIDDLGKATNRLKGTSENYTNIQLGLKELKKYSEKLAKKGDAVTDEELEKYSRMVKHVDQLAVKYLDEKVINDSSSSYARNRVRTIRNLRRHLHGNIRPLEDAIKARTGNAELTFEEFKDNYYKNYTEKYYSDIEKKAFLHSDSEIRKAFLGDYDLNNVPSSKNGFGTLTRTSLFNMAVLSMINDGEKLEDIYDPEKDVEKKQQAFNKVLNALKQKNNKTEEERAEYEEDMKWISETLYKGFKTVDEMVGNLVKKIDFSRPGEELIKDPDYMLMMLLGDLQHDLWQESKPVRNRMLELEKLDSPGKFNDMSVADYGSLLGTRSGKAQDIHQAVMKSRVRANAILNDKADLNDYSMLVKTSLETIHSTRILQEYKKQNKLSFSKWNEINLDDNREYEIRLIGASSDEYAEFLAGHSELMKPLMPKLLDGSLFNKVKFNYDEENSETTLTGLPTLKELNKIAEEENLKLKNEYFKAQANAAMNRLETKDYYNRLGNVAGTRKYMEDVSYVQVARFMEVRENCGIIDKNADYESLRKNLISSEGFRKNLMSRENPGKLMSIKAVVRSLKDDETFLRQMTKSELKNAKKKSEQPKKENEVKSKSKATGKKPISK